MAFRRVAWWGLAAAWCSVAALGGACGGDDSNPNDATGGHHGDGSTGGDDSPSNHDGQTDSPGDSPSESANESGGNETGGDDGGGGNDVIAFDNSVGDACVPDAGAPVCDPNAVWLAPQSLGLPILGFAAFASVTPDELSIAWTVAIPSDGSGPGSATVYYADRSNKSQSFGAPQSLDGSVGPFATGNVSLSADGLRMIYVKQNGIEFAELTRSARGQAFANPSTTAFANINAQSPHAFDPVVSGDDLWFYYSDNSQQLYDTAYVAMRSKPSDPWSAGQPLNDPMLKGGGTIQTRRAPTGISADGRTLFYFDWSNHTEHAVWRACPGQPFTQTVDLGQRFFAAPNQACDTLYHNTMADGGNGSDVAKSAKQ